MEGRRWVLLLVVLILIWICHANKPGAERVLASPNFYSANVVNLSDKIQDLKSTQAMTLKDYVLEDQMLAQNSI